MKTYFLYIIILFFMLSCSNSQSDLSRKNIIYIIEKYHDFNFHSEEVKDIEKNAPKLQDKIKNYKILYFSGIKKEAEVAIHVFKFSDPYKAIDSDAIEFQDSIAKSYKNSRRTTNGNISIIIVSSSIDITPIYRDLSINITDILQGK